MRALRTHYTDEAEFVRRVDEVQRPQGYRLVGAFDEDDRCLGVAGFRVIRNLAWGDSLYVDDLSTHPDGRRRGHGRALLEWCMEEGRREGCAAVPPRLRRRARARGRAPPLLQHRPAHHELPLRRAARMIDAAPRMALAAERELEALVGVSSPSGDLEGAEECVALATAFLPTEAEVERLECSTPGHARDLVGRLRGSGTPRVLLLGHLDTVVSHDAHRPLTREGDRLTGSGAVDMKGGVALSLGVMRELAARPELFAEAAILLVNDEEWRTAAFAHAERFAASTPASASRPASAPSRATRR